MARDVVTTWFGVFLCDRGTLVRAYPFPADSEQLRARALARSRGELVEEERRLLADAGGTSLRSRDRRFESSGVRWAAVDEPELQPETYGIRSALHRETVVAEARERLTQSWDASVDVLEAVRALADLTHAANVLGERVTSWNAHDPVGPPISGTAEAAPPAETHDRVGRNVALATTDEVGLTDARQSVAELARTVGATRRELERSIETAVASWAPNLSALLGPMLAAQLIERAGGLDRLARLPASTVQVLGAERAFFEHLRGRAPPPRHGLLFLHPDIHGAPRPQRGRIARALAGKASIAARLDRQRSPLHPELAEQFRARVRSIRDSPPPGSGRRKRRLHPPLDAAADDR